MMKKDKNNAKTEKSAKGQTGADYPLFPNFEVYMRFLRALIAALISGDAVLRPKDGRIQWVGFTLHPVRRGRKPNFPYYFGGSRHNPYNYRLGELCGYVYGNNPFPRKAIADFFCISINKLNKAIEDYLDERMSPPHPDFPPSGFDHINLRRLVDAGDLAAMYTRISGKLEGFGLYPSPIPISQEELDLREEDDQELERWHKGFEEFPKNADERLENMFRMIADGIALFRQSVAANDEALRQTVSECYSSWLDSVVEECVEKLRFFAAYIRPADPNHQPS